MIAWLVTTLQQNAELAIFVAPGIGYAVGSLKLGGFKLGNMTACLLAGVLVSQLNIPVAAPLRAFVFALFLFAVGYKVGPQFFAGLRRDGLSQIAFALFACCVMLAVVTGFATIVHFNVGEAAGLLSGSLTQSAAIGTASDAIARLNIPMAQLDAVITDPEVADHTVEGVMTGRARGVVLKGITRGTVEIPVLPKTVLGRSRSTSRPSR